MKLTLPTVLSFNAGYIDSAGFLALHGLFTAHVTGNLVMLGDSIVSGSSGIIVKLLAIPVFCLTVVLIRLLTVRLELPPLRELRVMLSLEVLLLAAGGCAAAWFRHFNNPEGLPLILTGMLLVAGMTIQNVMHKTHLTSVPPTTMMTGTTTQAMLDFGSLLFIKKIDDLEKRKMHMWHLIGLVVTFALGCAVAALTVTTVGNLAFLVPPVLVSLGLAVHRPENVGG